MSTRIFLGSPSNEVINWMKHHAVGTILNDTSTKYTVKPIPHTLHLSNDITSYTILPNERIDVKSGVYNAKLEATGNGSSLCADTVCINNEWAYKCGFVKGINEDFRVNRK